MRQGIAARAIKAETFRHILNALFCPRPQNENGGGQLNDDFGYIVNGLRIEADGQVPLARFPCHCGHVRQKLPCHRGIAGNAVCLVVAQSFLANIYLI